MTSSPALDRAAPGGVFVVRDAAVFAALEAILQPHYTGPAAAPAVDNSPALAELRTAAVGRVAELTGERVGALPSDDLAAVVALLDLAYTRGNVAGKTKAASEGREWSEQQTRLVAGLEKQVEQLQNDLADAVKKLEDSRGEVGTLREEKVGLESDLAHSEHRVTELERDLTEAKNAAPAAPKPVDGRSARGKDRKAFEALADRMDREAMSQPKTAAAILRLASKSVRDEIAIVYGNAERKAS